MKLKGSATIEAAVIIPLFTVMVLLIIELAIDCHDWTIRDCVSDKICMEIEFAGLKEYDYDTIKIMDFSYRGTEYVKERVLKNKVTLTIKEGLLNIKTDYSAIEKNNPVTYVWKIDALNKLTGKETDKNDGNKNNE